MPYNTYTQKSDFRKQKTNSYVNYYGQTNWGKVPQKLGFKPNIQVIKQSNYDLLLSQIKEADYVSLDTETSSLKWDEASLISINIGLPNNNNLIGFFYTGFFAEDKRENLADKESLINLLTVLLSKPIVFMWNRYYDQQILMHCLGFREEQFWTCYDGLDLLWLMDSNVKTGLNLKQAAQDFLGLPNWGMEEDVWEDIYSVDPKTLIVYGGYDAYATLELGSQLYKIFKKHYLFMLQLHLEFKNALFSFKEQHQLIDVPYVEKLSVDVATMIETVKSQFFESYGTINLGSSYQKSDLLLRLGYSTGVWNKPKKDGTKVMSTKEELLQVLADKGCEPAKLMIRYSKLLKLQSSYLTPMLTAGKSGKPIRFNFKDHDTATLRLSAGKATVKRKAYDYYLPISMQTLPKPHKVCRELNYNPETFEFEFLDEGTGQYYVETGSSDMNVRSAFCASENGMIIKADFTQEELVIPAVLANETTWLDAIKAGVDLHKATGRNVYGRDIVGDERGIIKGINFGVMYETENPEYVIANQTGWPVEQAREFFVKYKSALPRLYAWKDKVMLEGRTTGSIKNLYGFERRVYSYYHTANRNMHKFGDRTCVNQSVQGLAAIMMRILMVKFWKMLYLPKGKYYGSGISFVLSLHDEMVFRAEDRSVLPQFLPDFGDTMSSVTPSDWPVKLQAEIELGKNYGQTFVVKQAENGLWLPKEEKRKEVESATPSSVLTASMVDDWIADTEDELEGFNF